MDGTITIALDASFAKAILDKLNDVRDDRLVSLNGDTNYTLAGVINSALANGLDDGSVTWEG